MVRYRNIIEREAQAQGIDSDWIRAILGVEYGRPEERGKGRVPPMNFEVRLWTGAFGDDAEDFADPEVNIRVGAMLLRRIADNFEDPTDLRRVATVYDTLDASQVSNYGAAVQKAFEERPWLDAEH